jgi:hypothetical protein
MNGVRALALLALARVRRRPGRWLLTLAGLALAAAFAAALIAESTIAGDQAARSALAALPPLQRAVRVSWQGVVTPGVKRRARRLIAQLGLGQRAEVVLLDPVRLGGVLLRPAAVAPLAASIGSSVARLGPCRPASCPMLLTSAERAHRLMSRGVDIRIAGLTSVRSAAALGFIPGQPANQPTIALTSDVAGLERLPALGSVYRTHSWVGELPTGQLHSWQLAATEQRLQQAQAALLASNSGFGLTAPFAGLDAARSAAKAAPERLLLVGGGALAAVALFIVLAAGAMRGDLEEDLRRLAVSGASSSQRVSLVLIESALLCALAVLLGAVIATATAIALAAAAGLPTGGVLAHSLGTTAAVLGLLGGWFVATGLIALLLLVRARPLGALAATAALGALLIILTRVAGPGDPIVVLLAPLACLASGVLVARGSFAVLRACELVLRNGPVTARLGLVGLARAPGAPSLTIAVIAVSIGLGGFALSYRATLLRGTADEAANQVPLDAIVAPGSDFTSPLDLAAGDRWRALSGGSVAPVRRTEASFVSGASSVTIPALGVPASVIGRLHGWRAGDGTPNLPDAAHRLVDPQAPDVNLARGAAMIRLRAQSTALAVSLTADFLDQDDRLVQVRLGSTELRPRTLGAQLPPTLRVGRWRLAAIELREPTGLEITNGHQNAENPVAQTQLTGRVRLGPLILAGTAKQKLEQLNLSRWWAVGATRAFAPSRSSATLRFEASGEPGLLRTRAPSDRTPLPVLVDPRTRQAADSDGRIALTIDGVPVAARVVGVLRRFPTVPNQTNGFVIADERTLAGALDAQLPGQGRADELWISDSHPQRLQAVLRRAPFAQLSFSTRAAIEHQLRAAPVARAMAGTLLAASALSCLLALVGLLGSLLGPGRDVRGEQDLIVLGIGPRGLRSELTLRLALAAAAGVAAGFCIGLLLTRLAVATVHAAGISTNPVPPLMTVVPWAALALGALAMLAALASSGWAAVRAVAGRAT